MRRTSGGTSLVVRLLGCDACDPADGVVRETNLDRDCAPEAWLAPADD